MSTRELMLAGPFCPVNVNLIEALVVARRYTSDDPADDNVAHAHLGALLVQRKLGAYSARTLAGIWGWGRDRTMTLIARWYLWLERLGFGPLTTAPPWIQSIAEHRRHLIEAALKGAASPQASPDPSNDAPDSPRHDPATDPPPIRQPPASPPPPTPPDARQPARQPPATPSERSHTVTAPSPPRARHEPATNPPADRHETASVPPAPRRSYAGPSASSSLKIQSETQIRSSSSPDRSRAETAASAVEEEDGLSLEEHGAAWLLETWQARKRAVGLPGTLLARDHRAAPALFLRFVDAVGVSEPPSEAEEAQMIEAVEGVLDVYLEIGVDRDWTLSLEKVLEHFDRRYQEAAQRRVRSQRGGGARRQGGALQFSPPDQPVGALAAWWAALALDRRRALVAHHQPRWTALEQADVVMGVHAHQAVQLQGLHELEQHFDEVQALTARPGARAPLRVLS